MITSTNKEGEEMTITQLAMDKIKSIIRALNIWKLPDGAIKHYDEYWIPSDSPVLKTSEWDLMQNPTMEIEYHKYSYQKIEKNFFGVWVSVPTWIGMHCSM